MKVKVNGTDEQMIPQTTIEEVLEFKGVDKVAVELNGIPIKDYSHVLRDGDELEYLAYMAGGEDG